MSRAPRIALLTPGWPGYNTPNGIATAVHALATGLHRIGHPPVILTQHVDGPSPDDIPVVPVTELPWSWLDRAQARFGDADLVGHRQMARMISQALQTAIDTHGIDVLVMEETNGWAGMVAEHTQIPVVITLHGPWQVLKTHARLGTPESDAKRVARELAGYQAAAGLIAPSRSVLEAVTKSAPLPGTPKVILPNTLHSDIPDRLAATCQPRDILFVGRVDFLKGADTVLKAFSLVTETHPDARLTFVGPDKGLRDTNGAVLSMPEALARLPEASAARIDYKGPLPRDEVARLRKTHAIALMASRYEVFGYTILEAMAAGQAIVSTAVGGPAEVLEDAQTALLVPPADPDAMAQALRRLLDDTALTRHLGQAARAKLERDFNPETVAQQTLAFLGQVLSDP